MAVLYEWQVSLLDSEVRGRWKQWFSCLLAHLLLGRGRLAAGRRQKSVMLGHGCPGCGAALGCAHGWKGAPLGYGGAAVQLQMGVR